MARFIQPARTIRPAIVTLYVRGGYRTALLRRAGPVLNTADLTAMRDFELRDEFSVLYITANRLALSQPLICSDKRRVLDPSYTTQCLFGGIVVIPANRAERVSQPRRRLTHPIRHPVPAVAITRVLDAPAVGALGGKSKMVTVAFLDRRMRLTFDVPVRSLYSH